MGERLWYYLQNNTQMGPVPESELTRLLTAGGLQRDALVWADILTQWTPADQTESFGPLLGGTRTAAGVQAPAGQAWLSPSELMLMHADKFASKGSLLTAGNRNGNFKLLHAEGEVGVEPVARVLFATALLVSEQQGVLRLKVQPKKALFGLRTVSVLVAEPTGARADWPQGSYEASVQDLLARGPKEAADIFYEILVEDTTVPWLESVRFAIYGMERRGLVSRHETKRLLVNDVRLQATPEVINHAAGQDISSIQQLLANTEQTRPDVWQLLTKAINSAISRRTESSSDSDGPDFDSGGDSGD